MNKIKMIVTDLDGTLLRKDKTISCYSESVLARCREKEIKLVFATARPIRAVAMLNLKISFDAAIYHNGAVIYTDGASIKRYGIQPEATKEIISSVLRTDNDAKLCVEIDDRLYSNFDPSALWPGIEITLTDFTDLPDIPADKILLPMTTMKELNAVADTLPADLYIEMSENTAGMIMNKDAKKARAIKHLADCFGISLSEIVAFGDDYNDIEMLRECGIGVAVANAIDEAKSAADYICDTNDNDGIAKWLEANVL